MRKAVIALVAGTLASLAAFGLIWDYETQFLAADFTADVQVVQVSLELALEASMRSLQTMAGLYATPAVVEQAKFIGIARLQFWGDHAAAGLAALQWVPRVPAAERAAYEAAARGAGLAGFQFTERSAAGQVQSAAERAEYFPVYFMEPLAGNQAALGYDLGSESERRAALEQARASGQPTATAPIRLLQGEQGLMIFQPVYRAGLPAETTAERRANLLGFVVAVLRISGLVEGAFAPLPLAGRDVYVFDTQLPAGQ